MARSIDAIGMSVSGSTGAGPAPMFQIHALPIYVVAVAMAAVVFVAVGSESFALNTRMVREVATACLPVIVLAWIVRRRRMDRIADPLEAIILLSGTGLIMALATAVFATVRAPLIDHALIAGDAMIFGLHRERIEGWMAAHPAVTAATRTVYGSLLYMPALIAIALAAQSQTRRIWVMVTALMMAGVASSASILLFAAYGPPLRNAVFDHALRGLRDGSVRLLDTDILGGLIQFPSMHAADAVILAWASVWLGRWGRPLVVWNLAMALAAFTVGNHYLVDLIAGGMIGIAAVLAAAWMHGGGRASGYPGAPG